MSKNEEELFVPSKWEEVNSEWISSVLNLQIIESSFKAIPNAQKDNGYCSNLIRISFTTQGNEKFEIVVKLLPYGSKDEEISRALVTSLKMDKTEIKFYKEFLPLLLEQLPSLGKYFCKFYYSAIQSNSNLPYASVLILEDQTPNGFIVKDFSSHFSPIELNSTLKFLSEFHMASLSLEGSLNSKLTDEFSFFTNWYIPAEKKSKLHEWFDQGFVDLRKLLTSENGEEIEDFKGRKFENYFRGKENVKNEILNKIGKFDKFSTLDIFNHILNSGLQFPTAIHGDLWGNNILVNPDLNVIKVIDFQFFGYIDPIIELIIVLTTIMKAEEINLENLRIHVKTYYEFCVDLEKSNNLNLKNKLRTREEFLTYLETYGFSLCVSWFILATWVLTSKEKYIEKFCRVIEFLICETNCIEFIINQLNLEKNNVN